MLSVVLLAVCGVLVQAEVSNAAAKPSVTLLANGHLARVTFTAPWTTSRQTGYFVTWAATDPQPGCTANVVSTARGAHAGQVVKINLLLLNLNRDPTCEGPSVFRVFVQQRGPAGLIVPGAARRVIPSGVIRAGQATSAATSQQP